jgi:hypothetical protein
MAYRHQCKALHDVMLASFQVNGGGAFGARVGEMSNCVLAGRGTLELKGHITCRNLSAAHACGTVQGLSNIHKSSNIS